MDILVIKSLTGDIKVEQLNYAKFNSRPAYLGGEQITFIDKVKHIIKEQANLNVYKIGIAQDWVGGDGHGGGDYWKEIPNSKVDELDKMVKEYSFTPNELSRLAKIKEQCSNNCYSYVIPYKGTGSTEWNFMVSEGPEHVNHSKDNTLHKEFFAKALSHAKSEIGVYYDIGNYSLERIENTPLLSEVNMEKLINTLSASSPKLEPGKVTLSQISNARGLVRESSQYFNNRSYPKYNPVENEKDVFRYLSNKPMQGSLLREKGGYIRVREAMISDATEKLLKMIYDPKIFNKAQVDNNSTVFTLINNSSIKCTTTEEHVHGSIWTDDKTLTINNKTAISIVGSSIYYNPEYLKQAYDEIISNRDVNLKTEYKSVVEQYQELKSQSRAEDILLMQCGKFYNAFGEDAKKISEVANVKLIVRKPENVPMIGIPVDKFEEKFKKMLTGGGLSLAVSNVVDKHFNREIAKYAAIPQPEIEPPSQGFTHD